MRPARARRLFALSTALAACAAGCTWIVDFVDQPACDGGECFDASAPSVDASDAGDALSDVTDAHDADADPCESLADGAACGVADPCNERPTCAKGRCVHHPIDGAPFCAYLGGCNCGYCNNGACSTTKKCPEGFNWEAGDDLARCCGGLPVRTNTNANCGVCGVVCKTAGVSTPQDCRLLSGRYLCAGCSINSECWSQCCSTAPSPAHCAASDCNTGACPNGICPAPSHCVAGSGATPNYCSY